MGLPMASTPDNPLSKEQVEALFAHIETLHAEKETLRVEKEGLAKAKEDLAKENEGLTNENETLRGQNELLLSILGAAEEQRDELTHTAARGDNRVRAGQVTASGTPDSMNPLPPSSSLLLDNCVRAGQVTAFGTPDTMNPLPPSSPLLLDNCARAAALLRKPVCPSLATVISCNPRHQDAQSHFFHTVRFLSTTGLFNIAVLDIWFFIASASTTPPRVHIITKSPMEDAAPYHPILFRTIFFNPTAAGVLCLRVHDLSRYRNEANAIRYTVSYSAKD
ncbi:hypothetical protein MMC12_008042 [Toensbergia leucococca]|nr:hypothetical protein [Toensbergia leucococca]